MKKWMLPIGSVAAVAIAVVAVLAVVGVFDSDDASSDEAEGDALGVCVEGVEDCVDTIVDGDLAPDDEGADGGFEQTCLVGTEDCNDTAGGDGFGEEEGADSGTNIAPVCAPGFPDCADTVVVTDGEGGGDASSE